MNARWLLLCCAVALRSAPASAQKDPIFEAEKVEARKLADEGQRLFESREYQAAIARLRLAYSKFAAPTILLAWAEAHEKLGELVEARAVYQRAARHTVDGAAPAEFREAREDAKKAIARLENVIPKIIVEIVGGAPEGLSVTLDGSPLPSPERGLPALVNPGSHTVVIEMSGQAPETYSVILKEAETRHLQIRRSSAAPAPPPAPRAAPQAPGRSLVGPGITLGLGAAGMIVGAITGGVAMSKMSAFRERCGEALVCPPAMSGEIEGARAAGHVSTVSFAVGGASAALGVLLLALPITGRAPVKVGVGPTGVIATGRF